MAPTREHVPIQTNDDGSVDICFGPAAPKGQHANWVPANDSAEFAVMTHFYGPTRTLFDKTWVLPDSAHSGENERETTLGSIPAPTSGSSAILVTADDFIRAETDTYFVVPVQQAGGMATFFHYREPMAIDNQTVVRANRDTLYSAALIDLDAGPVTVTLPEAGGRFMSLLLINEDHYAFAVYAPGTFTYSADDIGTRYVMLAVRTFVDPGDPDDVRQVHTLQDAITIEQPGGPGAFEVPTWDAASQKTVRDALLVLSATLPDLRHAFGRKQDVDPVRHFIATASAWGGNPDQDALYLNVIPSRNDGNAIYRLTVPAEVPVDGFWSITVYNAEGYMEPNELGSFSLNSQSVQRSTDGTTVIQFGGCDGQLPNCLPTTSGWNYMVRLYRPRAELLDGTWTFPAPVPVG